MSEREVKLGFGMLFEVSDEEGRIDVVINVGKGGSFEAAQIGETKEGQKWFFIPGTADRGDIGRIVGQMSFEEVIKAAEEGARHTGIGELPKDMRDILEKYSKEKPRVLK